MHQETLDSIRHVFRSQKATGDGALAQLTLEQMLAVPAEDANSVAVLIRHLRGNMLSRWTGFLASDGEKPWRDRDSEFVQPRQASREELMAWWEEGWSVFLEAIDALSGEDVGRTVTIRGQPHSVLEALLRQLHHYGYHTGQIVLLARMQRGAGWRTLSIARGASGEYQPGGQHGEPRLG
jgi:hypothetical protein